MFARSGKRVSSESLAAGGQAVVEGVLMRHGSKIAVAVRRDDGKLVVNKRVHSFLSDRFRFFSLPFVRGVVGLFEVIILGTWALLWSASVSDDSESSFSWWEVVFTILFSLFFTIAVFKFLPLLLATVIKDYFSVGNFLFNLSDALIKIILLFSYIGLIGFLPDVRRLFQYHGAEHKTINAFEAGLPLTVKNVRSQSRFHPRCGTTFSVLVLFISLFFYLLIPLDSSFFVKFFLRVLFLPFIAGFVYELIRFLARFYHSSVFVRFLLLPGVVFQKFSTREPDDDQIRVAVAALKAVVR